MLLAFWAYAGFELSVLPAGEIQDAKRNIPKGIMIGVFLVMVFYIMVNLVVFLSLPVSSVIAARIPLASSMASIFNNGQTAYIIIAGGLISISGITLATIFELSRLLEKMASEGLFPQLFAKTFGADKIPVVSIVVQSLIALVVTLFADMRSVIGFSMILISVIYLMTGLSNWKFHSKAGHVGLRFRIVSISTIIFSLYLILQGDLLEYILSASIVGFGVIWYNIRKKHIKSVLEPK